MLEAFGPNGLTNVVQISGPREYDHLLALRADGTVTGLGYVWEAGVYRNGPATNSIPANLGDVVRVQAGNYFNAAILSNGKLIAWTVPLTWTDPVTASNITVPSVTFTGKVEAATNAVKVAIGNMHVAWLGTDGKVSSVHAFDGYSSLGDQQLPSTYPQTNTSSWSNVVDIAAGGLRTYGVVLSSHELAVESPSVSSETGRFVFPTAVVGATQKAQSFTVRNTGALPTTFSTWLSGQAAPDFQIVGLSGNITLQPGSSTNIQVRFAPTTTGANKVAQLKMAGNSTESVIELQGDAVSAQTGTNGVSPALRYIFRDFNLDLDHATQGPELLRSLGLYTPLSIRDLSFGARMIQKSGSNAIVELRLQTTDDLAKTPFTDHQRITNSVPMPGNKGFLRVKAGDN
jgi:hypothetical protein